MALRAIEFRGNRQADVEALAKHAWVPVYNGLTNEWHPTQMLADFLTMHEASGKPYDAIGYAFAGDCWFNMGRFAGRARQLTTCARWRGLSRYGRRRVTLPPDASGSACE
jgi:ornithine carbamoyltransferase